MPFNHENNICDDDAVQCFCFATSLDSNHVRWDNLCKDINSTIGALSDEYIWHRDGLKFFLPVNEQLGKDFPLHLTSITSFGDNIEDEWFIVHIILELTKKYKDIIVQIKDNDGDFLLIEAADHLPIWANPESTENRVFIHNNHIHLIPPNLASLDEKLPLKDAIQIVLMSSNQTQVSTDIEEAILKRIGNYPEKAISNTHHALVKVPLEIAALLKIKPNLIAPIANSYCHHDVIESKAFQNLSFNNLTTVSIKFTKCLYAMVLYSKFANSVRQPTENDKKTILGMKLTCGFQMIMKKPSDIHSSNEYLKFLNSLKENGYFKNNIEGSVEYKTLLQNAKQFFAAVECPIFSNVSNDITQIMASEEFLSTMEYLKNENVTASNLTEDNDDWLTIQPEQLNELLSSRYGKNTKFKKGDAITPHVITTELKDFLKQTSDYEGIETKEDDQEENKIDFDSDNFVNCVEKMLKLLSSGNINDDKESVESDFSDELMSQSEDEDDIDKELQERLHGRVENDSDDKVILDNMVRSIKEEKGSMGPTSSLISNVGLNKTDFVDSDDD